VGRGEATGATGATSAHDITGAGPFSMFRVLEVSNSIIRAPHRYRFQGLDDLSIPSASELC
jgi:hypothetical protein